MATWTSQCEKLLRAHGATLIRVGRRHNIWELNGVRFPISRGQKAREQGSHHQFYNKLRRATALGGQK